MNACPDLPPALRWGFFRPPFNVGGRWWDMTRCGGSDVRGTRRWRPPTCTMIEHCTTCGRLDCTCDDYGCAIPSGTCTCPRCYGCDDCPSPRSCERGCLDELVRGGGRL